jgi:hypothetical protein
VASLNSSSNFNFSNPSSFSPKSSPSIPSSRMVTVSDLSSSSSPTPLTSKNSKNFSVPKAVTKFLRSRIVQTTDQPRSTACIRRILLKPKSQSESKAPP